jgi:ubiquitin-like 1-activating enzyme E1 B
VHFTSVVVDPSRATLKDLVDDIVKDKLGYEGKEFVVNNDVGTLVECFEDGDDENLPKKLSDLGMVVKSLFTMDKTNSKAGVKKDSFLTVIDQDDDDTFVNVVINIQEG